MKKLIPDNAVLIPDNAKKVFEGVIFDIYQWPQKMFDGSVKTFEQWKRADTAQVIAISDGKMIVLDEEQPGKEPYYSLPAGRVDPKDTSTLEAAKRELKEETGLSFKNWKLISVEQPFVKGEWFIYQYIAWDLDKTEDHTQEADGEKISIMEMSLDEVRSLFGHPKNRYLPNELLQNIRTLEDLKDLPEFKGREVNR